MTDFILDNEAEGNELVLPPNPEEQALFAEARAEEAQYRKALAEGSAATLYAPLFEPRLVDRRGFRWAFGIWLPVFCFWTDPLFFTSGAFYRSYAAPSYSTAGLSMIGLLVWELRKTCPSFLCGVFSAASLFAASIGLLISPFSLPCTIIGIGLLGFIPFGTAWVYGNVALGAKRMAAEQFRPEIALAAFIMMALLFLVLVQRVPGVER